MRVSPWAHWSFAVVVATAVTTVACDAHRDDRRTRAPEVAPRVAGLDAEASQMLAHVPVDTPYVWLNAEPLPDAYVERLAGLRDATLSGWARALDERTDDPELAALAAELRGRMNPAGLRALGFATNPRWVLYGLGLAPVLRLELDDGGTRDDLEWVQAWAVLDAARRVRGTLEIGASGLELETIVDLDRR